MELFLGASLKCAVNLVYEDIKADLVMCDCKECLAEPMT